MVPEILVRTEDYYESTDKRLVTSEAAQLRHEVSGEKEEGKVG